MHVTKWAQREELAEVGVEWLIAECQGKILKLHLRKNVAVVNIKYKKANNHVKVCSRFVSSRGGFAS